MNGGLTEATLREWKAKAAALDEALEWLNGRIDSESLITINRILRNWGVDKS
jgi:hypothetical protein